MPYNKGFIWIFNTSSPNIQYIPKNFPGGIHGGGVFAFFFSSLFFLPCDIFFSKGLLFWVGGETFWNFPPLRIKRGLKKPKWFFKLGFGVLFKMGPIFPVGRRLNKSRGPFNKGPFFPFFQNMFPFKEKIGFPKFGEGKKEILSPVIQPFGAPLGFKKHFKSFFPPF